MDLRKFIVILAATIFFSVYFFTLSVLHFRYKTISDITVIKRSEFPPLEDSICKFQELHLGINDSIKIPFKRGMVSRLKLNGQELALVGEQFEIYDTFYCYKMSSNWFKSLENQDEFIELFAHSQTNFNFYMARVIQGRAKFEQPFFMAPINNMSLVLGQSSDIYRSLPVPFDTRCDNLQSEIRHYCIKYCKNRTCPVDCSTVDCLKIRYRPFVVYNNQPEIRKVLFSYKSNLQFESSPQFPFFLYFLQTVGLVTLFFDFCILDLTLSGERMLKNALNYYIKLRKRCFERKEARKTRKKNLKRFKRVLVALVFASCIVHLSMTTKYYFEYRTNSESFVGKPYVPLALNVNMCFKFDFEFTELTYEEINMKSKHLENIYNVHSESEIYFYDKYKCLSFSGNGKTGSSSEPFIALVNRTTAKSTNFKIVDALVYARGEHDRGLSILSDPVMTMTRYHWSYPTHRSYYKLLPPPFKSSCLNYNSIGFGSKENCINECVVKKFISKYGKFPKQAVNFNFLNITPSGHDPDTNITNLCRQKCPWNDCERDLIAIIRPTFLATKFGSLKIESPKKETSVTLLPSLTFVSYVTVLVTILNIWFGFGIFVIGSRLTKVPLIRKSFFGFKFFKFSLWIFIFIGFIYHLYKFLDDFFQFESVSIISASMPMSFHFQSITLVFEYNNLTTKFRNTYGTFESKNVANLTPFEADQLFKSTFELIAAVKVANQKTNEMDSFADEKLKKFLEKHSKSYIFSRYKVITINYPIFYKNFKNISVTKIKLRNCTHSFLLLHSGDYFSLKVNEGTTKKNSIMTNLLLSAHLLPKPYSTNCINYPEEITRTKWYSCILRSYKNAPFPSDLTLPVSLNLTRREKASGKFRSECTKKFRSRPSCRSRSYLVLPTIKPESEKEEVIIIRPREETLCEFVPKTSLLDLIMFLAEIFDIWLGINTFILTKILVDKAVKIN